jgi:arylsulfatase A
LLAFFRANLVAADRATANRPNVLLVMTDDQGYGDFSSHGNPQLKTPNLDKLAAESIEFDHFYVSPVCAPTRASLLTGRYHLRCGVWGVTGGRETMRPNETTMAAVLRDAGYRTALVGKWHLGEHWPCTPQAKGFDEHFGFLTGHWNNYFDPELLHNGEKVQTKGFITDVLTDHAIEFIQHNRAGLFFLDLAYNAPHAPYQVPDKYFDRFKATGLDNQTAAIYGMCASIDENIGRLFATLDELGLATNTLVIFLTDNGANSDRFNAGMRGRKGAVHEGGVRVPLFVRWPARFKTPKHIEQIAAHIDLFATILDVCDIKAPSQLQLDGRSLAPLLDKNSVAWPDRILFSHQVRGASAAEMFPGAARTQQYRLVNDGRGYELYDMIADPGEQHDIARDKPDIVAQLSKQYESWYRDVTRAGLTRPPIQVGYEEERAVELDAPLAYLEGGVRYFGRAGFAHDWITGWTNLAAKVSWQLDVIHDGPYEVTLGYLCPEKSAGSKIHVACGGRSLETIVRATPIERMASQNRSEDGNPYVTMKWSVLGAGRLHLHKGPTQLTVQALTKPGQEVMDLKYVTLKRLD